MGIDQTRPRIEPGETISVLGNTITFITTGEQTAGAFSAVEYTCGPAWRGPALHTHETFEELFYVLEGQMLFTLGDRHFAATAGEWALIPRGTPHTFANPSAAPARTLIFISPSGFEGYYKEMADLVQNAPQPLDMGALMPRVAELLVKYDAVSVAG